jgi:hypothetical protein
MAELILTEKEKADPSYLDWDTDALGKLVSKLAAQFKDEYGKDAIFSTFAIRLLVDTTILANANKLTQTIENVVVDGKDFGDWELVLKQTKAGEVSK